MKLNPIYLLLTISLIVINIIPTTSYCKSKTDSTVILSGLSSFNGIHLSSSVVAKITIKEGATPEVKLSGSYEAFKYYRIKVDENILSIGLKMNTITNHDITLYADIIMPTIQEVTTSGASDLNINGLINASKLNITASGSSDVYIDNINVTRLDVSASGSSDIIIKNGTASKAEYALSGSTDLSAYNLVSQTVIVRASGASDCKVNVTKTLDVALSGSSSAKYKGHPENIEQSISGGGELKQGE